MNNKWSYRWRRFSIRMGSWEYWPMWAAYLPASLYYCWLAMKARSFFFFSATNPSIENGGMFFESKADVYALIPPNLYPKTLHFQAGVSTAEMDRMMAEIGLDYPLVAKPDRGERGWMVKVIRNQDERNAYAHKLDRPFLLQAFVELPVELSIFYIRHPLEQKGRITSVTGKKLLGIKGDGISSIKELVLKDDRAFLQYDFIGRQSDINMEAIPAMNEELVLVRIGNHARGTTFLDRTALVDASLEDRIDQISKQIPGFHYGRFDILCRSVEDLKAGKHFTILELNGAGAEPAHIYQPGYPYFMAQLEIMRHFRDMYHIAMYHHRNGIPFMRWKQYRQKKKEEKAFKFGRNTIDL